MPSPDDTIAIIGLGLIGSSIARGIRERRRSSRVVGYDRDGDIRTHAVALGFVDEIATTPADAVRDADIVILCVPVGAMLQAATGVSGHIRPDAVLTDVGSSKASLASELRLACPGVAVVPGHPIAGSHASGPAAGSADLFQGRWCVLTPDEDTPPSAIERIASLWESLGARVELMTAEQHDLVLAATSHVPHLLAFASVLSVMNMEADSGSEIMSFSAGGFRDFTRIAAADPVVWRDTFLSNRDALRAVLALYRDSLGQLELMIETDQVEALSNTLATIRAKRLRLDIYSERETRTRAPAD